MYGTGKHRENEEINKILFICWFIFKLQKKTFPLEIHLIQFK